MTSKARIPRLVRCLVPSAAAIALAAAVTGTARADDATAPLYAEMKQGFTTANPGAWTGWTFEGALKPSAPGVQPPAQRSATFVFPHGTSFDLTGLPSCSASDLAIMVDGASACPEDSQVGSGRASLFLGAAGGLEVNAYLFLARPGFVIAFTADSGSVLRVVRASIHGNRVTAILPAVPLPGGYEVSVLGMSIKTARFGTREHPGLRTPRRCPKSGRWTFTYLPVYDQPNGVQRSTTSIPCAHAR